MGIPKDLLRQIERALRPIRRSIANSIARAVVNLVTDGTGIQTVQVGVMAGENVDGAERFQQYGCSSVPLAGAEAVVLFPGGSRAHPLVVAVDDRRYRPTGKPPGHACIYHHTGAIVEFTEQGDIVLTPATGRSVDLGSSAAAVPPALSTELAAIKVAIAAWTPSAGDGGASLKAVFAAWSVPGATKVDVE
jgi:phage baseplate assembly protein V